MLNSLQPFTDPVVQALAASMPKNLKAHRTHGHWAPFRPWSTLQAAASCCKPCSETSVDICKEIGELNSFGTTMVCWIERCVVDPRA